MDRVDPIGGIIDLKIFMPVWTRRIMRRQKMICAMAKNANVFSICSKFL